MRHKEGIYIYIHPYAYFQVWYTPTSGFYFSPTIWATEKIFCQQLNAKSLFTHQSINETNMAVMRTFDAKDYNKEEMVDYIEQIIIAAIWTNKQTGQYA